MAKKVQRQEQADVEVEVVGVVKHDGDYVEPGTRIMLTDDQARRLIASGHVKAIQKSKGKIQNREGRESMSADGGRDSRVNDRDGGNGSPPLDEGAGDG